MKLNLKALAVAFTMVLGMLFTTNVSAQSSCCGGGEKHDEASCKTDHKKDGKSSCGTSSTTTESTSGCSPSSCRGAKTKFGEAKVISNLRSNLVALKTKMEKSKRPKFETRSFDIHGIVGKSDDESLRIIIKELKLMETEFSNKTKFKSLVFKLPDNKAKQITYLESRIEGLKKFL